MQNMIIFIIFGALFVVIGITMTMIQLRLRHVCTIQTQGVVHGIKKKVSEDREKDYNGNNVRRTRISYAPIFRYYADNRDIIKESPVSSNIKFEVGSPVTLFYNPKNVEEYFVLEDKTSKYAGIFFALFGLGFMVIAIICMK